LLLAASGEGLAHGPGLCLQVVQIGLQVAGLLLAAEETPVQSSAVAARLATAAAVMAVSAAVSATAAAVVVAAVSTAPPMVTLTH
jgi:hypothetical protein